VALSKVQIGNMALAEVPAPRITSFADESNEAQYVNEHYQPAVELLLEAHDWDFAIRRVELAALSTNDRQIDWAYGYTLPTDVASPRKIIPTITNSDVTGYEMAQTAAPWVSGLDDLSTIYPFEIASGVLYTNLTGATLEYVTLDVNESEFPALFARALAFELASRICMPLKQSDKRQDYLSRKAEVARERAIADNMNRQPRSTFGFISEAALSRDW
jgi:hypothetical protein